ncbi:hypothetical protein BO1005MUT1_200035 [Hyphomicrobiales bacterium]|nr:hypothetical protein BO1005MUT1_200035 [Hyphomicrobiales bacterium]
MLFPAGAQIFQESAARIWSNSATLQIAELLQAFVLSRIRWRGPSVLNAIRCPLRSKTL